MVLKRQKPSTMYAVVLLKRQQPTPKRIWFVCYQQQRLRRITTTAHTTRCNAKVVGSGKKTINRSLELTLAGFMPITSWPLRGYEQATYFVYSFGFLIARSLAVSLIASRVHTASREPAQALYFVPSTAYCVEVQRFLDQIHGDTIALSGLQFFNVKRGLVLTIAGTIVTYELVLMQFTGVTPTPPPSTVTVPILINTSSTERTVEHICTHLRKHVYLEHVNARESNKCAYNVQHNAAQCRTLVEEHLYITDLNGTHLQQKFSV
ncbi:hypothetical protein MSG28_000601 [Choristoneura fumiferana]|uniref:Uncharacterized protein n=1 Tax=Choristoneura fumiferana TaxID=7141 RepID=A0ACC0K1H5_CHOFU|nr:hypothetical protein MSG28_000601 [Choristoneura fumiferana]